MKIIDERLKIYIDGSDSTNKISSFYIMSNGDIKIKFKNIKVERDYKPDRIRFENFTKEIKRAAYIMEYFGKEASACKLKIEGEELCILEKYFNKIDRIDKNTILYHYLYKKQIKKKQFNTNSLIFPFGINISQKSAIEMAFSYPISVIQGPPGTGKTQTILNIVANAFMQNKSVVVASSNNTAVVNVKNKLKKYNLDFLTATLGSKNNKQEFINEQKKYLDISSFNTIINNTALSRKISKNINAINMILKYQNRLSKILHEKGEYELEFEHFKKNCCNLKENKKIKKFFCKYSNAIISKLMAACMNRENKKNLFSNYFFFLKIFGIKFLFLNKEEILNLKLYLQNYFYVSKIEELNKEIEELETILRDNYIDKKIKTLEKDSLTVLKNKIYKDFYGRTRKTFIINDTNSVDDKFIKEYPIVFSTLYSLKNICNNGFIFDYLIVDEASQADIITSAISMSCAKNIVIVGDSKQLPNVITQDVKKNSENILKNYNIEDEYKVCNHSLLSSIIALYPNVPCVLLREHYRCHPKIIDFCNKKFYNNELLIMTVKKDDDKPLKAIKTIKGNHARLRTNQRQIDIITREVLPYIDDKNKTIGIISPYKDQVNELRKNIDDKRIEINTVHSFQGREKDVIIFSTVKDNICDFIDNPNLINVALSRAIKEFYIVYSNEKNIKDSNIIDLINYIKYNNLEVVESKVRSIFDLLYKQYKQERLLFIKEHEQVSKYMSENLAYGCICDSIKSTKFNHLNIAMHIYLKDLIVITGIYSKSEIDFIQSDSHVDFVIYSTIDKMSILAIEIDGYAYHKNNLDQEKRDSIKDSILSKANLRLLRLLTNGSEEKEKIIKALNEAMAEKEDRNYLSS